MPWSWALAFYLSLVGVPAVLAFRFPEKTLVWALLTAMVYAAVVFVSARGVAQRRLGTL